VWGMILGIKEGVYLNCVLGLSGTFVLKVK